MAGMKEHQPKSLLATIKESLEESLFSPRIDVSLLLKFEQDKKTKDFDPYVSEIGFIATVKSADVEIKDTLTRIGNTLVVVTPYANIIGVSKNPDVLQLEAARGYSLREVIKTKEITLVSPIPGPIGDEWDSPSYDSFWHPVEQEFQRKIDQLQKIGVKVKIG